MDDNDFMLTTFDNPFNPFEEFESWLKEDFRLQHFTCSLLDSLTYTNDELFSDEVNEKEVLRGMKEIVTRWPTIYRMVRKSDYVKQTV